jgi:hypothetical protein
MVKPLAIAQKNGVKYTFKYDTTDMIKITTSGGNTVEAAIGNRVSNDTLLILTGNGVKSWPIREENRLLVNQFMTTAENAFKGRKLVVFDSLPDFINRDKGANYGDSWVDKNGSTCVYLYETQRGDRNGQ